MGIKFGALDTVPLPDLQAAYALTVRCMRPVPPSFIVQEFTKCALVTKTRAEDSADIKARAAIFVEDLTEFPADVIMDAFRFWRRTEKFSPSVADIRERCWRTASARVFAKRAFESELKRRSA